MLHEKMGCLPVILEDTTLVGIVTESDFARLALEILSRQP
jgi:CBS domain-containing protein